MSQSTQPDKRHLKRIKLMQQLFASTFEDKLKSEDLSSDDLNSSSDLLAAISNFRLPYDDFSKQAAQEIVDNLPEIDQKIQEHAPERPLSEINQVDLAVLRIIVWESMTKKTPKKVLIDEAIELAKEYGSESSPKFVNGVLAKVLAIEE
jgi:transcription antitermination factor NusB